MMQLRKSFLVVNNAIKEYDVNNQLYYKQTSLLNIIDR